MRECVRRSGAKRLSVRKASASLINPGAGREGMGSIAALAEAYERLLKPLTAACTQRERLATTDAKAIADTDRDLIRSLETLIRANSACQRIISHGRIRFWRKGAGLSLLQASASPEAAVLQRYVPAMQELLQDTAPVLRALLRALRRQARKKETADDRHMDEILFSLHEIFARYRNQFVDIGHRAGKQGSLANSLLLRDTPSFWALAAVAAAGTVFMQALAAAERSGGQHGAAYCNIIWYIIPADGAPPYANQRWHDIGTPIPGPVRGTQELALPYWVVYFSPGPHADDAFDGKFDIKRGTVQELERIAKALEPALAAGKIRELKFKGIADHPSDPYRSLPPPLLIYASKAEREEILRILARAGVTDAHWLDYVDPKDAPRAYHAKVAAAVRAP